MTLSILGTGRALPALTVTNDDLAQFIDTSDEWIAPRTGIRSRQLLTTETITDLAVAAGRAALENAEITAEELDLILCTTIQGDTLTPSMANLVQRELGAQCPAFDINAACCGFIYGLDTALAYLQSGKAQRVLVISAEQMSRHVDWADRATCVLFGDGAAAAIVGPGDALKYIKITSQGDETGLRIPSRRQGYGSTPSYAAPEGTDFSGQLYMNGQTIFKFAVSACSEGIREALAAAKLQAEKVKYFILHQANARIIDAVRRNLGEIKEKFPLNVDHTGNMSCASLPSLLDELNQAGQLQNGDMLLLSAFGGGLTTGVCVLEWRGNHG